MNIHHLRTLIWLRWRLSANIFNRLLPSSKALRLMLFGTLVSSSWTLFLFMAVFGERLLPDAWNDSLLSAWNAIIASTVVFWLNGILSNSQHPDLVSWDKCLYFPISPREAFLLNVVGSVCSTPTLLYGPPIAGLSLAMAVRYGGGFWGGILLVPCFVLMLSVAAFQIRTWLALVLKNQQRRRWLFAAISVGTSLIMMLPMIGPDVQWRQFKPHFSQIAIFVPPFWIVAGFASIGRGSGWGALAAGEGMLALTGFSLIRSYGAMLRLYRGESDGRPVDRTLAVASSTRKGVEATTTVRRSWVRHRNWLECDLPGLNRQQSAMAMMTLRNLFCVPEMQAALFTNIIITIVLLVSAIWQGKTFFPGWSSPLLAAGICYFGMSGPLHLVFNQFGSDRDGFRGMLLSPAREVDILVGRCVAAALTSWGIALPCLIASHCVWPLHASHFIATVLQMLSLTLTTCLSGNMASILNPISTRSRSGQVHLGAMLKSMMAVSATMVPLLPAFALLAIELLVKDFGWLGSVPWYLIGAAVTFAMVVASHRPLIRWQGELLRHRRWRVLEAVTKIDS